ncbi:hypothetical protein [Microcoleus sp. D2_18a_D3]|uniref:hypothetical protein n=1 Tax=Microcoleus sp. D2_18a_D3 TaxID=3055330 RepID=UPI002FD500CB
MVQHMSLSQSGQKVDRLVAIFKKYSLLLRRQNAGGGCHPAAEDTVALTML